LQNSCKNAVFARRHISQDFRICTQVAARLLHTSRKNEGRIPLRGWENPIGTSFPPVRSTHPSYRPKLDSVFGSRRRPRLRQQLHSLHFAYRPACAPARGSLGKGPGRCSTSRRTLDGSPPRPPGGGRARYRSCKPRLLRRRLAVGAPRSSPGSPPTTPLRRRARPNWGGGARARALFGRWRRPRRRVSRGRLGSSRCLCPRRAAARSRRTP
jgi:hypothetical protein